jgi:6-pyruvoyl-tetrahydropterin synthase
MKIVKRIVVGAVFCAAHKDKFTGQLHGHTWEVEATFLAGRNASELQEELVAVLKTLDHSLLPDNLAWSEDIAEFVLQSLDGCKAVAVKRPLERIYAYVERIENDR